MKKALHVQTPSELTTKLINQLTTTSLFSIFKCEHHRSSILKRDQCIYSTQATIRRQPIQQVEIKSDELATTFFINQTTIPARDPQNLLRQRSHKNAKLLFTFSPTASPAFQTIHAVKPHAIQFRRRRWAGEIRRWSRKRRKRSGLVIPSVSVDCRCESEKSRKRMFVSNNS